MLEADLVIIGAGPAGMAAARAAADYGLQVLVLDEQFAAGGQVYRDVERSAESMGHLLGQDYLKGRKLTESLHHERVRHVARAVVWELTDAPTAAFTLDGKAEIVIAKRLLIATGAFERPMPVKGWELPGVMTVGAAQILLKQSGLVAQGAALVGSGPLLYLTAAQMCRTSTPPVALVETQTTQQLASALRYIGGAMRGWRYLLKGTALLAELRKSGVKRFRGATELRIVGDRHVEGLQFVSGSKRREIECGNVFLHHGVIPNTQATRSLGLKHVWDEAQACFKPEKDDWGRSGLDKIFIAGDGGGIGGAEAAALDGLLAALEIACDLGRLDEASRNSLAASVRRKRMRALAVRPFLDAAYPPYKEALLPPDDVIVCRCEEVAAGAIRKSARLGCLGPNQAKAYSRAGMGPCQGRYCGPTVTNLLAQENRQSHDATGYYRIRPPIKPVLLNELASLADTQDRDMTNDPEN